MRVILDQNGPDGESRAFYAGEKVKKFRPVYLNNSRIWYSEKVLAEMIEAGKIKQS